MRKLNKEESKSGKREVEGERRRVESIRICVEHLPSQVFGEHCSVPEVECWDSFWVVGVCPRCASFCA